MPDGMNRVQQRGPTRGGNVHDQYHKVRIAWSPSHRTRAASEHAGGSFASPCDVVRCI